VTALVYTALRPVLGATRGMPETALVFGVDKADDEDHGKNSELHV